MGRVKKILLEKASEFKDILFDDLDELVIKLLTIINLTGGNYKSLHGFPPSREGQKNEKRIELKKIILEIGCGNGIFFANLVKENPEYLCIGCDFRIDRLMKTIKKISTTQTPLPPLQRGANNHQLSTTNHQLLTTNFLLFSGDGKELVSKLPNQSIQKLYINFPDPHPRKKEWRERFFMPDILEILKEKMTPGGEIFIKTDDYDYFVFTRTIFYLFRKDFQETYYSLDVHNSICHSRENGNLSPYIITEFEQKWLDKGKKIYQLNYKKKN